MRPGLTWCALACALALLLVPQAEAALPGPPDVRGDDALAPFVGEVPLYCGGGRAPYFALTFDDGPGPYSQRLISFLTRSATPATFFLVGKHALAFPRITARLALLGDVGDHSWSHPQLNELPPDRIAWQLMLAQGVIGRLTRRPIDLFRPPFGENDPVIAATAARSGMVDVLWSVDSGDWVSGATASAVVARLLNSVRAGSIVLMHDDVAGMPSIAALQQALPILKARGLVPVTVSQLLVLDPPNMRKQGFGPIAACRK